ncbi:MAG TPA: type I restriction-modification system subunit M N-terminal domain-containing protein, partial [Mycobacterium sp.]|nr:type I restriction-modification system subunit M N-terminal domain-containing protein [Mycobacterium sp.]
MAASTSKDLKATLWKAAEKLRGSLSASQYKDVILGLVFLQHTSASHWKTLADNATTDDLGRLADEAMDAVMAANPALAGTLPRLYEHLDQRRLAELVTVLDGARLGDRGGRPGDLLGEVYEYFLGNFARAEGRRGGEFFTPPSVVR